MRGWYATKKCRQPTSWSWEHRPVRGRSFLPELGSPWFKADGLGSHTKGSDTIPLLCCLFWCQFGPDVGKIWNALVFFYRRFKKKSGGQMNCNLHWFLFFGKRFREGTILEMVRVLRRGSATGSQQTSGVSIGLDCSRNSFNSIRWIYRGTSSSSDPKCWTQGMPVIIGGVLFERRGGFCRFSWSCHFTWTALGIPLFT